MSKIANKQMICEELMEEAKPDMKIVALCSDSRGAVLLRLSQIHIRNNL